MITSFKLKKNVFFLDFFFFRRPQCRCCVMDAMWWVLKSPHHNRSNEESIKSKASPRYQDRIARVTQRTLCAASEIPFHFDAPNPRLIVQNINPQTRLAAIFHQTQRNIFDFYRDPFRATKRFDFEKSPERTWRPPQTAFEAPISTHLSGWASVKATIKSLTCDLVNSLRIP